jgi:hypothetical protein
MAEGKVIPKGVNNSIIIPFTSLKLGQVRGKKKIT